MEYDGCYYDVSKDTIPACNTSGVYTMHTKGANQTPRTSQFCKACVTSPSKRSQPSPRRVYNENLSNPVTADFAGDAKDKGRPIRTANVAASEKLSTEVMEMTVDARQRLNDLRTMKSGALVCEEADGMIPDVTSAVMLIKQYRATAPSCRNGQ